MRLIEHALRDMPLPPELTRISLLYLFLVGGGLWHYLGVFDVVMRLMAGPVMILLSACLILESRKSLVGFSLPAEKGPDDLLMRIGTALPIFRRFELWCAGVIILSFWVEWVGVKSGVVFGKYHYGNTLQPEVLGVPIAIGFAWLAMLLSTIAVVARLLPAAMINRPWLFSILVGGGMVVFDLVMEPAAIKLGYWIWLDGMIPLKNYAGWFIISVVFVRLGTAMRLFDLSWRPLAFHAFFAQLFYFILAGI